MVGKRKWVTAVVGPDVVGGFVSYEKGFSCQSQPPARGRLMSHVDQTLGMCRHPVQAVASLQARHPGTVGGRVLNIRRTEAYPTRKRKERGRVVYMVCQRCPKVSELSMVASLWKAECDRVLMCWRVSNAFTCASPRPCIRGPVECDVWWYFLVVKPLRVPRSSPIASREVCFLASRGESFDHPTAFPRSSHLWPLDVPSGRAGRGVETVAP